MKFLLFVFLVVLILIIIPMIIIRGCSFQGESDSQYNKLTSTISDKGNTQRNIDFSDKNIKIKVFKHKENKKVDMPLEQYVMEVVAAEMPADFEIEALKAQAVAARTFALGRMKRIYSDNTTHPDCDVCTAFAHCQAWVDHDEFLKDNGKKDGEVFWRKFERAVSETAGIIILYDGKIANPLFHSNSGGFTEAAKDVWSGVDVPYLKSVASLGEDLGDKFEDKKIFTLVDFLDKFGIKKSKVKQKDILEGIKYDRSQTGRVKEITILGKEVKGTDFRQIFGLCSTSFGIDVAGPNIRITTHGFGHGVGMSQWGANYLALNGGNFREILKHYYTGIDLKSMEGVN